MTKFPIYSVVFKQNPSTEALTEACLCAERIADAMAELRLPYERAFEIVVGRFVNARWQRIRYLLADLVPTSPTPQRLRHAARRNRPQAKAPAISLADLFGAPL